MMEKKSESVGNKREFKMDKEKHGIFLQIIQFSTILLDFIWISFGFTTTLKRKFSIIFLYPKHSIVFDKTKLNFFWKWGATLLNYYFKSQRSTVHKLLMFFHRVYSVHKIKDYLPLILIEYPRLEVYLRRHTFYIVASRCFNNV